jgi:hypothetical protein
VLVSPPPTVILLAAAAVAVSEWQLLMWFRVNSYRPLLLAQLQARQVSGR